MEEFLTFFAEAKNLGVTSLLLPVVVLGHSYISEESSSAAARIVHQRQYRDLKESMVEGPQSATWRRTIMKLAEELVEAASNAERTLGQEQSVSVPSIPLPSGDGRPSGIDSDDDAPGMAEVGEALETFEVRMQELMSSIVSDMAEFTKALSGAERMSSLSKPEVRSYILEVAIKLRPIGERFGKSGSEFEAIALYTDQILRSYLRYLRENGTPEQVESELESLRSAADAMTEFASTEQAISQFLEQIRPAEVGSAPLRKSIRGFRDGAKALSSGLRIIQSWPAIADE